MRCIGNVWRDRRPKAWIRAWWLARGWVKKITVTGYIETLAARERLKAEFASSIGPGELVVSPTLPHVAPLTAPLLTDDELFVKNQRQDVAQHADRQFSSMACGISLPCGTGDAGMPVGLLISGPPDGDAHLLSAALAVDEIIR